MKMFDILLDVGS